MNNQPKQIIFVGAAEPAVQKELTQMHAHWEITTVDSGAAAAALVETLTFDAVITDEALQDMDGFELLDRVQAHQPDTRRFILSDLADPQTAVKCARFAHQCVPKPWDVEVLRGMLDRAFTLGVWFSTPAVRDLIRKMTVVPSPPDLYFAVVKALNSPETGLDDIARRAEQDPAMTARLLKVANSAALGLRHQVTNAGEAISYLGLETTRSLILLTHTFSYCDRSRAIGFSIDKLWQHSLAAGQLARRLAREERASPNFVEESFLAGLLHDLGELLLAVNMPDEYSAAIKEARERQAEGIPLWQIEAARFGAAHPEIGAELMAGWSLPMSVVEALALHHRPAQVLSAGFCPLTAVHVADAILDERETGALALKGSGIDLEYIEHLQLTSRLEPWRQACLKELDAAPASPTP